MTIRFLIFIFLMPVCKVMAGDVAANATRPSSSDNAYLTARGYTELEIGWSKIRNFWTIPALLKLSVHKTTEVSIAMTGIVNHPEGGKTEAGTPGAQVKVQLTDQSWGAIAAVARMDWPSRSSPVYTVYPVTSLQTSPLQIDLTLGGVWSNSSGGGYDGSLLYAASFSPKLPGEVGVYAEAFGSVASGVSSHSIDFGISFAATPRFILDASVGFGLSDDAEDWVVQVGFTTTLVKVLP